MNDLVLSTNDHNAVKSSFGSLPGQTTTNKMTISSTSIPLGKTTNVTANSVTNTAQSFVDGKNDLKKKKSADLMPTIRFELKLEPPTSDQFSEYNYNKLVVKTLKIIKKKSRPSKSSAEVSDMDETQRKSQLINKNNLSILENDFILEKCKISSLLSHFRKKVILSKEEETNENNLLNTDLAPETNDGFSMNHLDDNDDDSADSENSINNGTTKSKKSKKKTDQYDSENIKYKLKNFNYLGQGYDEEDSFIDNSEAQDERVPSDMAPKKGGFYINKGNLKMEKIEEQKLKRKAAKKQQKLQNAKKHKEIKEGDSSTDEDFNPNEDEAKNGENDVDMSEKADDSSSDDESESDTDSDSENSGSDESDASEISEVSGTEELKNEEEIKLRNHKRVKTNMESNEMNNGKPVNENDSSCEIIDIRSRSNSCSSTQKSNKRRMIDDDDENENEETDDNTAGKENIENKITSLSHDSKNPTSSSVNLNSSNQRNVKRKRQKEHPNLPSGVDSRSDSSKTSQQHAKDIKNEKMENNSNLNLSNHQPKPNNSNQRRSLPNEINNNLRNNIELSLLVPANIKELIERFINSYRGSNPTTGLNVWTDESKSLLFKIYKDSTNSLPQAEKSQIFTYISSKVGKTRESLMRHCRNQLSKEQQSNQQSQPTQQQPQQQQSQSNAPNRPPSELKQAYYQKLNSTNQSSITINDISEELHNKLTYLDNAFKTSGDTSNKFFESQKTNQLIHSIDNMTRITSQNSNVKNVRSIRDFTLEFLCKLFEITRDTLLRTLNQIRTQHIGNQIKNKITMLKKVIDEEMPKQINKHIQAQEEHLKNKAAFEAIQQAAGAEVDKKKINPPRKKFEWTVKTRDLYLQITQLKMSLYRSASKPPHQSPEDELQKKNEYLKTFLLTSIINLWPDNWMQMNVLLHMSQQKSQSTNKNTASNVAQSTANNSGSPLQKPFVTNGAIINLASKSGKQIRLEHQPLSKPQAPPSTQRPSTPNQKPVQKPATPQLNRSLQIPLTISDTSTQPITNLTNTRPNTPKQSQQSQHISPTSKKNNVYDNLVTQYKTKPIASPTMNLEKALNSTSAINTSTPSQIANKSPNSLTLQQQQQQKLYRQQQIELTNIFNANNLPNSQFNLTSALNFMMSPNNSYSKNANSNN